MANNSDNAFHNMPLLSPEFSYSFNQHVGQQDFSSSSSSHAPSHTRYLSQPSSSFILSSLPPHKELPSFEPLSMVEKGSSSSIPLSDNSVEGMWERSNETDFIDDMFADYIDLENMDMLNSFSFGTDEAMQMPGQSSPANSIDNDVSLEIGNVEFSDANLNEIRTNEKLVEIAMTDSKRAKRMLANRKSAARSKERKRKYIAELEHKVQSLQVEATTLSSQVTLLQGDSAGLTEKNNELKLRLQALNQQAQLHDALNNTLAAEVERLKHARAGLSEGTSQFQQLSDR